jgi:hypothetical protein
MPALPRQRQVDRRASCRTARAMQRKPVLKKKKKKKQNQKMEEEN